MPRTIFKCPHIKGGSVKAASHLNNYVSYMATRDGVERIVPKKNGLTATQKQKDMVAQLVREFPLSKGLFEYEDYTANPTSGNASAFITRALEDNLNQIAKKENYLEYIAQRPRAEKIGSHGLFSNTNHPIVLSKVAETIANHPGTVWLPIISLRREDAARLGFDNAAAWKNMLSAYASEMAKAMKIPVDKFHWYAAFHDEGGHPHVHMVCYSEDPKTGFLSKDGIAQIKSGLARKIFEQDLHEIYEKQTQRRDILNNDAEDILKQLVQQMQSGTLENEYITQLMLDLARRLKNTSGKKQYGYLKPPLKAIVDEIVEQLAKDPQIAEAYNLWYELREDVLHTYKDDLPERLPLSRQKEFRKIKNLVIREAVWLLCMGTPVQILQLREAAAHEFPALEFLRCGPIYLEVTAKGISKRNAVKTIQKQYQISREEIVACGDSFVDLEMLRYAGLGITMGNAPKEVKRAADMVTATNLEDGVYIALKNLRFRPVNPVSYVR